MLFNKFDECIRRNKVNHSHAREAIYKVFLENINKFLSVSELRKKLLESYPKKISVNTVYRHLNLFVSCNILLLVQDDNKKAYYILVDKEVPLFEICPNCQSVDIPKVSPEQEKVLIEILEPKKNRKASFIVLHKACKRCQ
ncbi:MAG: transcriptional repressor [Sulfurovaceae bacterium]|nr:transcriptional repressor [Sulfurovaceae bacterium]